MAKELAPGASVPQEDALLASCDDASGSDLDGSASGALSASPPSSAHAALAGREGVEPRSADGLQSRGATQLAGTKHAASSSPSPPPKKRHITPKARPKKMQEILRRTETEVSSAPFSSPASSAVSVPASPPGSASKLEPPVCPESTLCTGRSFEELMAAAGIDMSQPLPPDSSSLSGARGGATGRSGLTRRGASTTGSVAGPRRGEKKDEKRESGAKARDASSGRFPASRPSSAVSTAGGSSPLSDSPALTASEGHSPALRLPLSERAPATQARSGEERVANLLELSKEPGRFPDISPSPRVLNADASALALPGRESQYAPASPPASPSSSLACSSSAPACGSEPSSSSPTASAEPAFGGEASEHEVFAAIPLSLRLTSKTVKHRVHGCEELLQRFVTQPEKSSETFAANLQGATLERLLKDSNPLVLSKVVDFMLAYVRAVAGAGRVALSAERAVSLLQAVAPPTLQNVLANPRLAPQAGEFLSLLAAVHPEALSCLMSLVIAANAKLLAEKKGNVALLKGAAIKQLTAALQLLQTLVEDFGVPAINAAGGLKLLLEKSVGPFCCVSDKKVRGVCTALAAHAVWLAGASEAAKKLATDAVKNSKAMQTDVLALLEAKDSEAQRDKPKRVFRLGASAEAPDGEGVPSRKGEDRDGEVVLAEETDVLKLVCQQGDWTQRVTEGKQKKAAGNNAPEPSENELPWKVKMQAWQQLEEALRDCVCMAKKNPFLPSLLSLVHRCLTLEPTLPVVSCCLRVLQHLVRHLLSDLSAASFASFSSAGSSSPPQQLRVLLPGVAAKLKVNNRQVQVAATSCLGAFLRALPLDVACAELLPMKEKLAGYRQALLEALAAAVPAETENEEPRLAARNLAFWRATPLLVQAAKAGADDGAPGVRTAALQLLAKIGGKGEGGAAAISSVLDALQDQKRQQVLKLMAAVPSSSSSAASSPSPLAALSSAVTGCRKQLRPARVPSLASGIEQSQAGAAASRSSLRGPEKEKRAKGDEDERRGREEKMKPCKTDEKRRPRERKDSDAENKQPLSARGRADPVASHRPHTAGAHRGASPSSSSSWSSLSFALSWDVPDCPVSLAEAERVAERMWEAELLAGLRSPNGLARRGACERLAEWWRRPCECRACARKLAASEEASSATEQQECKDPEGEKECLQRTKSQYAVHLILFMRVSVANFREKSLAVQEAVLACLAAAVESLTLSGKPRTPEEKEETPLTITSAFDVQNPKPEKAETKRRPVHPSLAALIVAPLVDKIGDPRVGSKVQTLCLSLAEVFSSPLPVAASLIEAAEGNLVVSLPVSPGVPSTVRSGSLEKRQERQGDLWPDERRREGFPLKKSGETGACTARIGERPRVGCASAIGGATGRACQALCAVLERLVHDWGYEKLTPVKTLVLFARQIIDGQKATAAQANRSGGMRLMAELCAQLGEKNLHSILLSQPLPDDLRTAVKHLAESLSRQSPSSNRSPLGAPHQATSSVAPVSLVERAMQCFSSGAAFVASAVGEIAGPGSELYLHRARKPVSVAPLLTQECLGVLQSSQKKPFGEKKGQAAKDEKEEVAALKECIRVIAVEGGGCIKAEGLSTLVPILRSKVGDPRPAVSRFALLLASAVCDALAKQPGQCKDEEERRTETGQECGTETGAGDAERTRGENKRPSRGCHLYKDSLLPAIFDRLHGTDRRVRLASAHSCLGGSSCLVFPGVHAFSGFSELYYLQTVELAHIATLKWLQAIGPEEAVPLLLPCLERALSALPRSASFSGRLGSSSPRVLSSLSFSLSSSVSSSLASSVSSSLSSSVSSSLSSSVSSSLSSVPAREADSADGLGRKVGEALIALLVASRFSFGASAGVSEAHAATLSRRLLPLLFSLLRAALKARESSRDARESSRAAEVVDLLEALIAQVERHLGDAAAAGVEAEKQKIRAWEAVCASERASDARERAEEHTPLGEPRLRSGGEASDVEVRMEEAGDVQGEKGGDRGDQGGEKEVACVPGAVAESSPTFPRGLAPPSQDLPSSPSLSLPPSLPPSSCFSLGGVRECRYTVAAPLVVLGVLLQTLQSLHLRLSLTDQQAASALLLDLRSQAALHEVLQGKKATERREKGERRKSVSSPLRVPSSGRESWPTGAAFVQEKHQTVIRELLLLLATVAGEPAALVCTLHRQLAKTKNRNLVYDVLEAVCVALEHHLRLASPFALSVREKVEKGATWEKWEKSSLALSFSAVELSSTFPAYAAAQAQFAEFLLGQMVPRICQILTGPVLVEDKERREGERLSLKEIALKALALCNSVTKGGVLNASSLHLTAELRSRLCELGKSLASAVAPLSCFPLPPHERCSDYVFAAPVPVALSLPVSQRRTDSSRVSSSLERLGRGEKGGDGSTSLARERSRGASREKLAQPKRADGAPPGKEKPDTATKNEQRESAQALEPPALAGAQDLAEKEATGKTPKQEAEPEERKREAAQGEGARGKDDFDFLDTGLQNLIRERRQEQQALVDTMRETDRQTTALRSGAAFEPVLAQVQEAKEAAEACFSSLQTAHREQSVKALGSIAAQQMRAEEAHANCHCLPCFLPASSAPAAAPGVDPEGPLEKLPRSFSLLHRPAGREEKTDEGLVGAVVSMVKLWCGELYEKDVVRLERAAHCLLYLFTNIPLDPTTTRACADFSVDSGSPLTFPSLASLRREEENWGPRDGDASRALPLCAVVEQLFASRAAKAQANSPVAATSSSGAFLAGLSAEADAVLFHAEASSLVSSVLFESLLHGLDNIFNPAFFDGSTSVAIASFHTILSLLLLLEVLLRKLLAPSKAPEPPSSSAKASAREAPRALLQWKPLEVSGAAPGEDGEEGTAGGSEGASAELLGPTAMARACKQLLLCMSRYQAFVYKAAAPAAKELLLPRLLVTTLLNQCLGKNMLRGSLPSLTSLVAFVFTLAGEQMHGMYPDLNADTSWRFLSKIHRRVTTKLLDAKWDGASRNGCEWSSKESREESLAEGKVLSERKRLQQVIPQDHLLQLVHAVLSSWFILEGRHEAAVVTLQQRQKLVEDETQKAETGRAPAGRSRSGFASFVEKQRSLAFIYFRLFMHTLVRFCSEALGKYLLAQRISSTSVQGKRLETLLSSADPLSSAGAPTAFAALEAAVKGASEAREGLRGFSCSACIALARRAEEGKDVLEKEDEVQEGDKKKRTLSSESEETTGSLAPRERKERRTGEEGRREKRLCFGEEVKTFVASAVDAEQAKLAELMKRRLIAPLQDPLAHVGDGDAAPETASALHLLRSRFRNAFCLVAQQPFDTADDLSLQPYLSDIRARLCRAQVDLEQQDVLCAADSGSDGARLFGRGQTSAKTWRDRLVDFLTRSVALMDVFPVPDQGRGRTGCAWAAGPACVGLLSVENVEGRSGEEVQGGEQVARGASRGDSHWAASFPSGKRWVNLDAVANMFKIEVPQFGRGGGDTKRPESGPDRRPGLLAGKHEAREGRSGAVLTQEVRRHGEAGAGPRAREDPVEREKLSREEEGRAHEKRHSKEETDDAGAKACSQAALGTHGREPPSRHDSSVLAGIAGGGGVEASNAASASAAERLGQPDPHRSETHVHETISQQFTRETTRVTQETFDPRQPK
ncbi:conserved hypothetical protein, partial [Neospora caninum Liverpool]